MTPLYAVSKKLKKKDYIFLFTSVVYIVWLTFPLASYYFPITSGVINAFVFATIIVFYPKAFVNRAFFWVVVYLVVLFLYVLIGKVIPVGGGDFIGTRRFVIEAAFVLPAAAIINVLLLSRNLQLYKMIALSAIISLAISFIIIIPLLFINENLLRSTVEGENIVTLPGVPYYTLVHAYALILMPLLYLTRCIKGKKSILVWTFFLLISFVVFSSKVTTILLVLLISLFWYLINQKSSSRTLAVFTIVSFLTLFLYVTGVLNLLLDGFAELFKNDDSYYGKIKAITSTLQNSKGSDTSSVDDRGNLHYISWNVFFSNPLFGGNGVGGHSGIIDRLGGLGVFGFIPFIMFVFLYVRYTNMIFHTKFQRRYYFASVVMVFLLLYEKGLFGQEGWLFFLVLIPSIMMLGEECVIPVQQTDCDSAVA